MIVINCGETFTVVVKRSDSKVNTHAVALLRLYFVENVIDLELIGY